MRLQPGDGRLRATCRLCGAQFSVRLLKPTAGDAKTIKKASAALRKAFANDTTECPHGPMNIICATQTPWALWATMEIQRVLWHETETEGDHAEVATAGSGGDVGSQDGVSDPGTPEQGVTSELKQADE